MVFKKKSRRTFKKRSYKKRSYRSNPTWGGTAKRALKIAMGVAKLVNAETKFFDINQTVVASNYNGTIAELCLPTQGVSAIQREGDSIKMKNLTWRGMITYNGQNELVRLIIFIDNQNTITTGAQLLQTVGLANAPFSPKQVDNKYDSKILLDREYMITINDPIVKVDFGLEIDTHLHFNYAAATVDKNDLKYCIISQTNVTGATYSFYSRVTYMDN